ncbi:hypothetical protein DSO57_1016573 [Entomophthora muscae]|uniref:Uncharacterized protein n=1 Tax=Entomophthora muscae TaxID=34485 RepID=A0ACC2RWA8_9FUNG|nr:hypothetical protein DSO57_1016573 [Entomophthora muscae]
MREKGSYLVRIQILADLINNQTVVIAETQSAPILVRGRSPIHYSRKAAGRNTNPSTPRGSNSPSESIFQSGLESLVCHGNPRTSSLPRSKKGLLDFILN